MFLSFVVSFAVVIFNLKAPLLTKKASALKSLSKRSYKSLTWESIKGKLHQWQKLEFCKVLHNVKLHR